MSSNNFVYPSNEDNNRQSNIDEFNKEKSFINNKLEAQTIALDWSTYKGLGKIQSAPFQSLTSGLTSELVAQRVASNWSAFDRIAKVQSTALQSVASRLATHSKDLDFSILGGVAKLQSTALQSVASRLATHSKDLDFSILGGVAKLQSTTLQSVTSMLATHSKEMDMTILGGVAKFQSTALQSVTRGLSRHNKEMDMSVLRGLQKVQSLAVQSITSGLTAHNLEMSEFGGIGKVESVGLKTTNISPLTVNEAYESAIHEFENLYDDVVNGEEATEYTEIVKEFLQNLIAYCKKMKPLLNTLNSAVLWDVIQKIAAICTIYSVILGGVDKPNKNINIELEIKVEEQRRLDEEINNKNEDFYENDINKDEMNINPGLRI